MVIGLHLFGAITSDKHLTRIPRIKYRRNIVNKYFDAYEQHTCQKAPSISKEPSPG